MSILLAIHNGVHKITVSLCPRNVRGLGMHQLSAITAGATRVLVSDSTRMGCQLLAEALRRSQSRFVVSACAVNSKEILKALTEQKPDVALIAAQLQDGPLAGFTVLRQAHASSPTTRCILLVETSEPETVTNAFRAGAKGIFCRAGSFEALCKCIGAVHKGQVWANSTELQFVLESLARATPLQRLNGQAQLTKREEEVVALLVQGLTNREISTRLNLSAHTVKNYLFRIFEKLGVSSRVELVLYALDQRQSPSLSGGDARGLTKLPAAHPRSTALQPPPSSAWKPVSD